MVQIDFTSDEIEQALKAIVGHEELLAPEFEVAGKSTVEALVKDYRKGVGSVTGELRAGITGEVKSAVGVDIDGGLSDTAQHGGYSYGQRLDRDGSLSWRSGPYAGRRTFGWWHYVWERNSKRFAKRYFSLALKRGSARILGKLP